MKQWSSNLLYGTETWRIKEKCKKWMKTVDMDAFRRYLRISRREGSICDDIEGKYVAWF